MDRVTLHPEHGGLTPLFVLLAFHRALGRLQLGHLGGGKERKQDQHHRDELGVGNGGGKFGCRRGGGGACLELRATEGGACDGGAGQVLPPMRLGPPITR